MAAPEKRKPVTGKVTGFQKIEKQANAFDRLEDSPNFRRLQAVRLRNRFVLSEHMAHVLAALVYGEARP